MLRSVVVRFEARSGRLRPSLRVLGSRFFLEAASRVWRFLLDPHQAVHLGEREVVLTPTFLITGFAAFIKEQRGLKAMAWQKAIKMNLTAGKRLGNRAVYAG